MVVAGTGISSRWDRYLGMTAAMTQVPVPTASSEVREKTALSRKNWWILGSQSNSGWNAAAS